MKKVIYILTVVLICAFTMVIMLSACGNKQFFDTTYTFRKAIIGLPDGTVVEGSVSSWKDYENSDQLQVVINDTTYLIHASNVVLISD